MGIEIKHIEYYLPEQILTNDDLQKLHPDWEVAKVAEKSGVEQRHIAKEGETAFHLAKKACDKFFEKSGIKKETIDGIIFCTQSPDFIMPSNAFLIHQYLDLSTHVLAFDYNLACSGYIYGLVIARGLIATNVCQNILLINADTYSKYINENDRSTKVLFGDAAAVSLIAKSNDAQSDFIDVILESSGKEYNSFYIPAGGCRLPKSEKTSVVEKDHSGNIKSSDNIHMNGFGVWKFISKTVPIQINALLARNKLSISSIDIFIFHQASKLTLDSLVNSLKIPKEKTFFNLNLVGNTVSASIPIAFKDALDAGRINRGNMILLSGFGVGLSWGSILIKY